MKPTDPQHKPKRWLRNRLDGTIYEWNEILAENAKCEEVSDMLLFPEAYIRTASQMPNLEEASAKTARKPGRPKKDLGVDEMVESQTQPPFSSEDFSADVSRGWPK